MVRSDQETVLSASLVFPEAGRLFMQFLAFAICSERYSERLVLLAQGRAGIYPADTDT